MEAPRWWVRLEGLIRAVEVEPAEPGVDTGELERPWRVGRVCVGPGGWVGRVRVHGRGQARGGANAQRTEALVGGGARKN